MISLNQVSKKYSGSAGWALEQLTLDIPEGTTIALIGPSGCGKTTTMRLINRLEDPSAGQILVNGEDISRIDPVQLRRHIGYVIQQTGLFPHMNIAENIATVPRLLGWPKQKIAERIDELLELVGLDPKENRHRYPHEMSGGQRQRVGVARALAADPPVMLMDEPFGAIDPMVRGRLQDEFKLILQRVKKTVVIVTHDLDEAIKMGDRIAIMRAGRLLQCDTPANILAAPANDFVKAFVGADRALKRLGLIPVRRAMTAASTGSAGVRRISADTSLKDALALMLAEQAPLLGVTDAAGQLIGELRRDALFEYDNAAADVVAAQFADVPGTAYSSA